MNCTSRWIAHRSWNRAWNWCRCRPRRWATCKTFHPVNRTTSTARRMDCWRREMMKWSTPSWEMRSVATDPTADDFPWLKLSSDRNWFNWSQNLVNWNLLLYAAYYPRGSCCFRRDGRSKVSGREFCLQCQLLLVRRLSFYTVENVCQKIIQVYKVVNYFICCYFLPRNGFWAVGRLNSRHWHLNRFLNLIFAPNKFEKWIRYL